MTPTKITTRKYLTIAIFILMTFAHAQNTFSDEDEKFLEEFESDKKIQEFMKCQAQLDDHHYDFDLQKCVPNEPESESDLGFKKWVRKASRKVKKAAKKVAKKVIPKKPKAPMPNRPKPEAPKHYPKPKFAPHPKVTLDYVTKCGDGAFYDEKTKRCQKCVDLCEQCKSAYTCDKCFDGFDLLDNGKKCWFHFDQDLSAEPMYPRPAEFWNEEKQMLQKCDSTCGFCTKTATNCTHCHQGFVLKMVDDVTREHTCVEVKPVENHLEQVAAEITEPVAMPEETQEKTQEEETTECHERCAKCSGDNNQNCDECKFGYNRVFNEETQSYTCQENGSIGYSAMGFGSGGIAIVALGVAIRKYYKKKEQSVEELRERRVSILNNQEMFQASLLSSYQL